MTPTRQESAPRPRAGRSPSSLGAARRPRRRRAGARAVVLSSSRSDVSVHGRAATAPVGVHEQITVAFSGSLHVRVPRHPAALGRADRRDRACSRAAGRSRPARRPQLEPGGPAGTFGVERSGDRVRIVWRFQAGDRDADVHAPLPAERARRRLRRRRRRQPQGLGRRVGAVARPAHRDDERARRTSCGLGPPGLGARRRRRSQGRGAAAARARRPAAPVRRAAHALPAHGVHLDRRDAGRGGQRAREDRRRGARRTPPRTSATRSGSTTRSPTRARTRAHPPRARHAPGAPHLARRLLVLRARASRPGYDREYEQEPPTDTAPALVPTLLRQGGEAGLVRVHRDAVRPHPPRALHGAGHVTTERSIWGGLRTEQIADLESRRGRRRRADAPGRRRSPRVVDDVLADGPERLSRFRERDRGRARGR